MPKPRPFLSPDCLAIVVAAAMVVLAVRLKSDVLFSVLALSGGLATILPAISLSLLIMALTPMLQPAGRDIRPAPEIGDGTALALKVATYSLIALGFSSVLFVPGKGGSRTTEPSGAEVAATVPKSPQPLAVPPAQPVDPKTTLPFAEADLTPEAELDTVPISRWRLKGLHHLGPRVSDGDCDVAADERTLAYLRYDRRDLVIADLEHLKVLARVNLPHEVRHLRFDPDASRLLALPASPEAPMMLVEVREGKVTELPRTLRSAMPSPPFAWWSSNEILLQPAQSRPMPALFLLDRLEAVALDDLTEWTKRAQTDRDAWLKADRRPISGSPRFRLHLSEVPSAAMHPAHDGTPDWTASSAAGWLMADSSRLFAQRLDGLPLRDPATARPVLGGKAALIFHGATTDLATFTVVDAPQLVFAVPMPHEPGHEDCSPDILSALKEQSLVAVVYPPLTNPLTGKVIGPDRRRIKALVRFRKWEGTTALVQVETQLHPVATGDVIADSGRHSGAEPSVLSRITLEAPWWAQLQAADSLPAELSAHLRREDLRSPWLFADGSRPPAGGKVAQAFPKDFHYAATPAGDMKEVREFIRQHVEAANHRDFERFANDFGERVDPYFAGPTTRSAILEGERRSGQDTKSTTETVISPIQVAARTDGTLDAAYRVKAYIEYTAKPPERSTRRLNLHIRKVEFRFEIIGVVGAPSED